MARKRRTAMSNHPYGLHQRHNSSQNVKRDVMPSTSTPYSLNTPAGSSTGLVPKLQSPMASTFSFNNSKLSIATQQRDRVSSNVSVSIFVSERSCQSPSDFLPQSESRFGGSDSSASLLHMSDKVCCPRCSFLDASRSRVGSPQQLCSTRSPPIPKNGVVICPRISSRMMTIFTIPVREIN